MAFNFLVLVNSNKTLIVSNILYCIKVKLYKCVTPSCDYLAANAKDLTNSYAAKLSLVMTILFFRQKKNSFQTFRLTFLCI